ncbi:MAG: transposase [Bryobacteraceae bacterium]
MADNRVFTPEFRVSTAERMLNGESISALSAELKIKRSVLYRWRDRYRKEGAGGFSRPVGRPPGRGGGVLASKDRVEKDPVPASAARRIAELERRLGQLALENDFLERAFKRVKEAHSNNNAPGEVPCTEK